MRITLEGTNEDGMTLNEYNQFTIKINDKDKYFQVRDYNWDRKRPDNPYEIPHTSWSIYAQEIKKLTVKTPEEKAAEESVAKAKEALKAAENALKVIKDK